MSLKLPEPAALLEILETILDGPTPLRPAEEPFDFRGSDQAIYVSLLRDDEGGVQGAVVADAAATIFLGGALIMVPAGAQQEQWRQGRAEESITDAMSEIVNMLRSVVNGVSGNPHVAPDPLVLLDELAEEVDWLPSPTGRLDLAGELPFATGHLSILAR